MYYREQQNHRWAHNLSAAKRYFEKGELDHFYNGDLEADFKYPGMKILGAFWVAEDMEMKERIGILTDVLHLEDEEEYARIVVEFYERFISDFNDFGSRFGLFSANALSELSRLARTGDPIPGNWNDEIASLQSRSNEAVSAKAAPQGLLDEWFFFCGRFILSYARNLIRQGVRSALFVKYNSREALEVAIQPAVEYFSWQINRVFFNIAMPQTGFEDLGDIVALGAYGMLADQAVSPSTTEEKDGKTYKRSYLDNCQLYGLIDSCADFLGMEKGATPAYCQFCVGHGRKTMHFVIPPDRTIKYSLEEGLGYGGNRCVFLLETEPGEDDDRANEAMDKIFGDCELSYK